MPSITPAPDLAARLGDLRLPDASGTETQLSDLWASRPVVLAHLRHFG